MKFYRIVLTVVAFCLLCTSVVTLSMGWLTNVWSATEQRIPFSAGNTAEYTFYRYSFNKDGTLNTANSVTDGSADSIGAEVSGFTLNENDLQFGTLTNLYFLESDNVVFYAVKIPASMGTRVNVAISYGEYDASGDLSVEFGQHFRVYEKVNDTMTEYTDDTVVNMTAIRALETKYGDTFVSYACALSTQAPSDSMTFDNLNNLFKDGDGTEVEALPVATLTKAENADTYTVAPAEEQHYDAPSDAGTEYYLYIKLQPNMEMYKYFIDYLYAHMPFYLSYQVGIKLYVNPTSTVSN